MGAEQSKEKECVVQELPDEELSFLVKNTDHTVQGVKVSVDENSFGNFSSNFRTGTKVF